MNNLLRYALGAMLVLATGAGAWWVLQRNQAKRDALVAMNEEWDTSVPVAVAPAERVEVLDSFSLTGTYQPWQQAAVVPTLSGQVLRLLVRPGQYVRAGQVLLEIDNTYTRNELQAAEINLEQARKNIARMENLIDEGGVTRRQYEEAKAQLESGEVKLRSLRKRIQDARITAPVSGHVTPIPRTPFPIEGGFVGQGNPLFLLVDIDRLKLRVLLTPEQMAKVRPGSTVRIEAPQDPEGRLEGRVVYLGVTTEMLSKRYPVDLEVRNPPTKPLRGGMTATAHFVADSAEHLLLIPAEAVLSGDGPPGVYVVEGQQARYRSIVPGRTIGNRISVRRGLQEGEQVVRTGQINLQDRTPVVVVEQSTGD